MRKIRILVCLAAAMLLCGCSRRKSAAFPAVEPIPAGVEQAQPCSAVLPRSDLKMELISESPAGACWESPDGECCWITTLSGPDPDKAMLELTGYPAERLRPFRQERFGMEEYRFSWTVNNEDGTFLCLGQLHKDDNYCYGLAVCCREDAGPETRALCSEVYANYELHYEEGA